MIAAAFLLAQVTSPKVRIVEILEPSLSRMEIQSVVKLPTDVSPRERAALTIITEMIPLGTEDYSKDDLLHYAYMVGEPVKVTLSHDHIRIGFSLPPNSQEVGANMLSNLLRKALLREDEFKTISGLSPFKSNPAWASALKRWSLDYSNLTVKEIAQVYARFFRPENITVAVVGQFSPGQFDVRFSDWIPRAVPRRIREGKPQELYKSHSIATVGLWADMANTPYPPLELASIALGLGKHGAAFRVIRNQLGQSYRQESMVSPGPRGLRLGVVYQTTSPDNGAAALDGLGKDIEGWSEATLARARSTVKALNSLGMSFSSVYLDSSPLSGSPAGRAYWTAFANQYMLPLDRRSVFEAMETVTLEQLKVVARRWVSGATIEVTR